MLKVLMLVNYFPPEIGSGPHLPFELETLVQRGCQVTVMTGFCREFTVMPRNIVASHLSGKETAADDTSCTVRTL